MFIDYNDPNNIVIKHDGKTVTGHIAGNSGNYWLHVTEQSNLYPFVLLNVGTDFVLSVLGYTSESYNQVKTTGDLIKVLDALNEEYDKKFGKSSNSLKAAVYSWNQIKMPFTESLKDIANSSVDQTISINNFITKKNNYQLNFNN